MALITGFSTLTSRSEDILPPRLARDMNNILNGYMKRYDGDRFHYLLDLFREHVHLRGAGSHDNLSEFQGSVWESLLIELHRRYEEITTDPLNVDEFARKYRNNYTYIIELILRIGMNTYGYIPKVGYSEVQNYYKGDGIPENMNLRQSRLLIDQQTIDEATVFEADTVSYRPIPMDDVDTNSTFIFKFKDIDSSLTLLSEEPRIRLHFEENASSFEDITIVRTQTGFSVKYDNTELLAFSPIMGRDWVNCILTTSESNIRAFALDETNGIVNEKIVRSSSNRYQAVETLEVLGKLVRDHVHETNGGVSEVAVYANPIHQDSLLIPMMLHEK